MATEIFLSGKRLQELKVAELKAELDKRGLPKRGVKSVLITRLKNAILREELTQAEESSQDGNDTETSLMDTSQTSASADEEALTTATKESKKAEPVESQDQPVESHDQPVESHDQPVESHDQPVESHDQPGKEELAVKDEQKPGGDSSQEVSLQGVPESQQEVPESLVVDDQQQGEPEEVTTPQASTPVTEAATDHATPLTPSAAIPTEGESAIDDGDQDVDIEGREETPPIVAIDDSHPMDIATPLSSGSDFDDHGDDALFKEAPPTHEEEEGDVDVVGEGVGHTERLDSIDPSYQPESEELLYEGDMEHEGEPSAKPGPVPLMEQDLGPLPEAVPTQAASSASLGQEEGFIVALHDTSQDLDVGTSSSGGKKEGSKSEKGRTSSTSDKSKATTSAEDHSKSSSSRKQPAASTDAAGSPSARSSQCNLWVSGLGSAVRALDLQTLFSPFGQVISAKVVAKPHSRSNRFGYVTMATPEQAQACIRKLNNTELKGRKITVEVAKSQPPLGRQGDQVEDSSSPVATPTSKSGGGVSSSSTSSKVGGADKDHGSSSKSDSSKTPTGSKKESGSSKTPLSSDKPRRSFGKTDPPRRSSEHKTVKSEPRRRSRSRERGRAVRRSRTPPPLFRRSPPFRGGRRARSRSPHRVVSGGAVAGRGAPDARQDILRREMERRMQLRDRERQVEMRLQERRLVHDRQQEIMIRRQLEAEHSRREQEMMRRMQEARDREAREREVRERQLAEQERAFKERERELREKEYRERQRREALERELKEREMREKEFRDREKKLKELQEKESREREMKAQRDREAREREARMQAEREKELRERERRLKEEQERIERERHRAEEEARRMREQAERARLAMEREESERRERRMREEKEQKRQEDDSRARREREQKREREEMEKRMHPQSGRLGKRPYQESGSNNVGYESSKRQAMHGSSSDSYSSAGSNVFGRLDPPPSDKRNESAIPPLMTGHHSHGESMRRGSDHGSGQGFERRSSPGGYNSSRVGYTQGGRDRHGDSASYSSPLAATSRTLSAVPHQTTNAYSKVMSDALQQSLRPKTTADLAHVAPDIINAATQALENIRKSGQLGQISQGVMPKIPTHLGRVAAGQLPQQLNVASALSAAAGAQRADLYGMGLHQSMASIGALRGGMVSNVGVGGMSSAGGVGGGRPHHGGGGSGGKLPPEEERYNRRLGRSGGHHHGQPRQGGYKSRM